MVLLLFMLYANPAHLQIPGRYGSPWTIRRLGTGTGQYYPGSVK
jgi:hypothetical protein